MDDRAFALLVEISKRSHLATDDGGNAACFYCGDYASFTQRDGRRAGGHTPECVYARIKAFVEGAP